MKEPQENEWNRVDKPPPFLLSVRVLTSIVLFFGYCNQYMLKINMSIAIVCMVNNTALAEIERATSIVANNSMSNPIMHDQTNCPSMQHGHRQNDGPLVYPKSIQGIVLSSYFYGYILTQIPGGWLSFKFGGKNVLAISMGLASIFTLLIPISAKLNYIVLSLCRFVVGLCHGVFWPTVSGIFVYWAPPTERSRLVGASSAGAWVGNIVALPLGGFLCVSGFDGGWPSIFYIFGIICLVWTIIFFVLVSDHPEDHKFISAREKDYIVRETKKNIPKNRPMTPWKAIFKCRAVWGIFIAHFCSNWGLYLFLTNLPTFLKDVLKFDIKSNGLISALPYVASCFVTVTTSIVSDKMISKGIARTTTRKILGSIGMLVPLLTLIGLSFVTCTSQVVGVVLLIVGIASNAVTWSGGHMININDCAGPFAGILFGISNTIATIPGIVSPYFVGILTKHGAQSEWRVVLIICAVVYFIGFLGYVIFADGNVQEWAKVLHQPTGEQDLELKNSTEASNKAFDSQGE